MTQDVDLKNYQLQWKTEKGGGSVSWNTEQARPDDDDDDDDEYRTRVCSGELGMLPYTRARSHTYLFLIRVRIPLHQILQLG